MIYLHVCLNKKSKLPGGFTLLTKIKDLKVGFKPTTTCRHRQSASLTLKHLDLVLIIINGTRNINN